MANNTTLIPLVQADIDALNGTQTIQELTTLKVAAVKLGMDTSAIDTRIDALDMSSANTKSLVANAVANTLGVDALVIKNVPNLFNRIIPKGTEICVDPLTGNYLPRSMAMMTPKMDIRIGSVSAAQSDNVCSVITDKGKIIFFSYGFTSSSPESTLRISYSVFDPLTDTLENGLGTALITLPDGAHHYSQVGMVGFLPLSNGKWASVWSGQGGTRATFKIMSYDDATKTVTFTGAATALAGAENAASWEFFTGMLEMQDGSVLVYTQGTGTNRVMLGLFDPDTGAQTSATIYDTLSANLTSVKSTASSGYGYLTPLSDGNLIKNDNGTLIIVSFDGVAFTQIATPAIPAIMNIAPLLQLSNDIFGQVYYSTNGNLEWIVIQYTAATNTLTQLLDITISAEDIQTPPPVQNTFGSACAQHVIGNTVTLLSNTSLALFSFDPVTFDIIVPSIITSPTLTANKNLNKIGSDARGLLHISSNERVLIEANHASRVGSYFTAGSLIPLHAPIVVGVLENDSTTSQMDVLITADTIKGSAFEVGGMYGGLFALDENNAVHMRGALPVWARINERVKLLGFAYASAQGLGTMEVEDWVGGTAKYQVAANEKLLVSGIASRHKSINAKVALAGTSPSTFSYFGYQIFVEGFPCVQSIDSFQSDTGARGYTITDAATMTVCATLVRSDGAAGNVYINAGETA